MDSKNVKYSKISYEDLFGKDKDLVSRYAEFNKILKFLGLDPIPGDSIYKSNRVNVLKLFSPKAKLNTIETYSLVPNIKAIEEQFGSDTDGYLFK